MNLRKDQRGIGHVIEIVIIAVIVVGVAAFIWWRVVGSQNSVSQSNSAQNALQKAIADAACSYTDKDLCKFMTGWKVGVDYRVVSTIVASGQTTTFTLVSANQGKNTHQTMNINGAPYETIMIGNTTYTKDHSDNKWWKQTVAATTQNSDNSVTKEAQPNFTDPNGTAADGAKVDYKKIATEACGNLTCFKYQIVDPSMADTTQYIWFDTKDYQLRRMNSTTSTDSSDFTFSYDGISVSAPSPTKDLPANQYLIPGTDTPVSAPNPADIPSQ